MNGLINELTFLVGNGDILENMKAVPTLKPFSVEICDFLSTVSEILRRDRRSKDYPDIVTFAFWIRHSSLVKLEEKHIREESALRIGCGTVFHVAPSNVPVNFAYSLVSGLLMGNANVVRLPSKDYEQVKIIADSINEALSIHQCMRPYIALVRYRRCGEINDFLSSMADVRVIWGGDRTIAELRHSPLPPRGTEISFADRYSMAVIDSDVYIEMADKVQIAKDFYNDTYLSDQNACSSPRVVVWIGSQKERAKEQFWGSLHDLVESKYYYQNIMSINKLSTAYLVASEYSKEFNTYVDILPQEDNLLIVVKVGKLNSKLMDYRESGGLFYEYDCDDVMEKFDICNDKRCQTIGIIGDKNWIMPIITSGARGVDRVVPIGRTMDFDLVWDGYELVSRMTRIVSI